MARSGVLMQGVIKSYDPESGLGSLVREADRQEIELAANALEDSIFRFLRQGQRVNFDLTEDGFATHLRFGSEGDMKTPTVEPPLSGCRSGQSPV